MQYLVAAVVLVGLLGMVNLLLTVGVIRRLRGQSSPPSLPADGLSPGARVPRFIERLAEVARVVTEAPQGPLQTAFKVNAYPTVITIDAGDTVVSSGHTMPHTMPAEVKAS
ncbi:hypothetical protein [Nonomuraea sp. NPDC049709]|uniref:hypothetical protein n=1 Tax=Nonomuraea sp. NPDC049709 TaxID=3154736 RepID=UPI003444178F